MIDTFVDRIGVGQAVGDQGVAAFMIGHTLLLVLMNDPTYVEAARKFAERAMAGGTEPRARLQQAFRLALARSPSTAEETILLKIYANAHERFTKEPAKAEQLLAVGSQPKLASVDSIDLAAWTTVCSTILNLDETISKR